MSKFGHFYKTRPGNLVGATSGPKVALGGKGHLTTEGETKALLGQPNAEATRPENLVGATPGLMVAMRDEGVGSWKPRLH